MANSFQNIFLKSKISWDAGSSYHSLSFSEDGKTLAGTAAETGPAVRDGNVRFWDTENGSSKGSYNGWSLAQFSPTDRNRVFLTGGGRVAVMIQDGANPSLWKESTNQAGVHVGCFNGDGTRIAAPFGVFLTAWDNDFRVMTLGIPYSPGEGVSVSSLIYAPNNLLLVGHNDGVLTIQASAKSAPSIRLSPIGSSRVGVCAWSIDGKWLATGDDIGDTRLWDASDTTNISLSKTIKHSNLTGHAVVSLVFVPDSTALIIVGGGYVFVWDIGKGAFQDDRAGLPRRAKNIALSSHPDMGRVALAADDKIYLYDIKPPGTQPDPYSNPRNNTNPRKDTRYPAPPSELAPVDISSAVSKTMQNPYPGFYFEIYKGVWKVNAAGGFDIEVPIAIKSLRPGFNPDHKTQEQQEFESFLNQCLLKWHKLKHDNVARFWGISMAFGPHPALVTSWMTNGLLTLYLKTPAGKNSDKMQLIIDIGRGLEYLHSEGIVHSDIRASSVLVNEHGVACLADPGLLSVFTKSPLAAKGASDTWAWMAPELFASPPKDKSNKTDVYAFTMTSWEIYSGEEPFNGLQAHEIFLRILQDKRPDPPANVKNELRALWDEGWNKDDRTRPDMASYLSDLERIARG